MDQVTTLLTPAAVGFRSIDLNKPVHEPGNLFQARGNVPTDLDGGLPKKAGHHFLLFAGFLVPNDPKLFGKPLVKKPVDQANKVRGTNADFAGFDLGRDDFLHLDMNPGLHLSVADGRFCGKVVFDGSLDVDRVGVVTFNQV